LRGAPSVEHIEGVGLVLLRLLGLIETHVLLVRLGSEASIIPPEAPIVIGLLLLTLEWISGTHTTSHATSHAATHAASHATSHTTTHAATHAAHVASHRRILLICKELIILISTHHCRVHGCIGILLPCHELVLPHLHPASHHFHPVLRSSLGKGIGDKCLLLLLLLAALNLFRSWGCSEIKNVARGWLATLGGLTSNHPHLPVILATIGKTLGVPIRRVLGRLSIRAEVKEVHEVTPLSLACVRLALALALSCWG